MREDAGVDDLCAAARAWLIEDPDPATRAELARLLDAADVQGLRERFAGPLEFGTAGLRAPLGAGESRMNRAVVRRTAAGLARHLLDTDPDAASRGVVVGYDARHGSADFALDSAAVLTAAGLRVRLLPRPLPTPVLAFAVRHLGCAAGVMVTASHNPATDNGYKVYAGDGAQIVPPADAQIAARIADVRSLADVPIASGGWEVLGEDVLAAYLDAVVGLLDPVGPRQVRVAYTPLHGVGGEVLLAAFARAGFPPPLVVAEQAEPEADFPTVGFPNPEVPGALDRVLALAAAHPVDLVIANDPDADRLALAAPDATGRWRALSGDETGVLLADWVLSHGTGADRLVATTIVSSRLLGRLAHAHDVRYAETLTGFKWLARAGAGRVFAYEEALGVCVGDVVADKDGISAALVAAEMAAWAQSVGRPLPVLLDHLAVRFGVHATGARSLPVADLAVRSDIVDGLLAGPPTSLGGAPVSAAEDLRAGAHGLPPTDGMRLWAGDSVRVVVRPSGTEPLLKTYAEVVVPVINDAVVDDAVAAARLAAAQQLDSVLDDVLAAIGELGR